MYMSKLSFDARVLARDGCYEAHQALWKIFSDSPDRERDFLYRAISAKAFLAVSARAPERSSLLDRLEVKPYDPRLAAGERLLFSLRVNPVRKAKIGKKQFRHDVVQDLRKRLMEEDGLRPEELPPRPVLAERAGRDWLAARQEALGLAVDPDTVMAEAYVRERFRKAKGPAVTLGRMDLRGYATVTDPEALRRALFEGVGCAKGFGFGLLLVRRV